MPSSITHELIAAEAAKKLPEALQSAVSAAPDYYYLGAQGPDVFFFYKPLGRREYNFGKTLHRKQLCEWFSALLGGLKTRTGDDLVKCRAYALGFCTHVEADVAFHPFVYAYLEKTGAHKRFHQQMENDWDVVFLKTLRDMSAYNYKFPFDCKKIAREGVLFPYIAEAAKKLGRRPVTKGAFKRGLRFFAWYQKHFHRRHFRYLKPFAPRLYLRDECDPSELGGEDFYALSGGKAHTAQELFALAADAAAALMEQFYDAIGSGAPLPREKFGRNLLTGKQM